MALIGFEAEHRIYIIDPERVELNEFPNASSACIEIFIKTFLTEYAIDTLKTCIKRNDPESEPIVYVMEHAKSISMAFSGVQIGDISWAYDSDDEGSPEEDYGELVERIEKVFGYYSDYTVLCYDCYILLPDFLKILDEIEKETEELVRKGKDVPLPIILTMAKQEPVRIKKKEMQVKKLLTQKSLWKGLYKWSVMMV